MKPYVYIYLDTRKKGLYTYKHNGRRFRFKHQPFYVGIAVKENRCEPYIKRNIFFQRVLSKILAAGLKPIIFKKYVRSWETACGYERYYIKLIGRRAYKEGPLTNLTAGGEGGFDPSPRTRRLMRKAKLGISPSQETRDKMSDAKKGKKRPKETCNNISIGQLGKTISPESIEKCKETKRNWSEERKAEYSLTQSIAQTGRTNSLESNLKRSKSLMDHEVTEETRSKIGKGNAVSQIGNSNRAALWLIRNNKKEPIVVGNLSDYCRENNLNYHALKRSKGRTITKGPYEGYKCKQIQM